MRAYHPGWMLLAALAGCSPAFNWREVRPVDGGGVALMFPCKPDSHARRVRLGDDELRLELHACRAGEITWALAMTEVSGPDRVAAALTELQRSSAANLGAEGPGPATPLIVPGATPHLGSVRLALRGRLPDGQAVRAEVAVFARGTHVYQATALGATLPPEPLETFFASLRVLD